MDCLLVVQKWGMALQKPLICSGREGRVWAEPVRQLHVVEFNLSEHVGKFCLYHQGTKPIKGLRPMRDVVDLCFEKLPAAALGGMD